MGGLDAGEEASAVAIATVRDAAPRLRALSAEIQRDPGSTSKAALLNTLTEVFQRASTRLYEMAEARDIHLGATLTVAVVSGRKVFISHVGDSRVYIIRRGRVFCLTRDHTLASLRMSRGNMALEEYEHSPLRNVLYQAMGLVPDIEPDTAQISLEVGDKMLLCTDGVWGHLENHQIVTLVSLPGLQEASEALVHQALENGSDDNLTAVLMHVLPSRIQPSRDREGWDTLLTQSRLFRQFNEAERGHLMPFLEEILFGPGEQVYSEGDIGESLYVVLEGEVTLERDGLDLARLEAGDHFGELSLILRCARFESIRVTQPCRLLKLEANRVKELVERHQELGARLMDAVLKDLAKQVVSLTEQVHRLQRQSDRHRTR